MNYLLVFVLRLTDPLTLYTEVLFFSTLKLFLPHQLSWWLSHNTKYPSKTGGYLYFAYLKICDGVKMRQSS